MDLHRVWIPLGFLCLAGIPSPVSPQVRQDNTAPPGSCTWIGTVTIERRGNGIFLPPPPDKEKTITASHSRTVNETITIAACGLPGQLYIKSVTRTLQDHSKSDKSEVNHEALCRFPPEACEPNRTYRDQNYVPVKKSPGNSMTSSSESRMEIYSGLGAPLLEEHTSLMLSFPDENRFSITGQQTALGNWQSSMVNRWLNVCCNKTAITEVYTKTGSVGQVPESDRKVTGEGEGTHEILNHLDSPLSLRKEFQIADVFDGRELKGSRIIDQADTPIYKETTTAKWDLRPRSACDEVYRQLREDLAFGEAYAEKKVADFAGSIKQYEKLVSDRAYRINHGRPAPPNQDSSQIDAATDEQGKQSGLEKLRRQLKEQCSPDVIYDSIVAHEDVHTRQSAQFREYTDGKPFTFGQMEVSAYVISATMLMDWLRENCPQMNLDDAENRLAKLEALGQRYMPKSGAGHTQRQ
jgi:hypothetical protein